MVAARDFELELLLQAIYEQFHYDFRGYARASLRRRMAQAVERFGCSSLSGLQEKVIHDPQIFRELLSYLTVQVTDMFRDPGYFRIFREEIVPILRTYPSRKIWVAGCSTGEEAYAFAIVLREENLLDRSLVYATDIHAESLRAAETGVYPLERVRAFSENHRETGARCSLSEHYRAAYGGAVFDRVLRKHMVFADHSLATDSVFAEVQVISCRNVLIYFNRELQERALGLFGASLCRGGLLGVGSRESLRFTQNGAAFEPVHEAERWYRKRLEERP